MAKNTLIGSDVYISPMNNSDLYLPSQPQNNIKKTNSKISSEFYPSVEFR